MKKTAKVLDLLKYANEQLARTDKWADDQFKSGICVFIEHILRNANCYAGYNDTYWMKQGCKEWIAAGEPDFPEKDKYIFGPLGKFSRFYYTHKKLLK